MYVKQKLMLNINTRSKIPLPPEKKIYRGKSDILPWIHHIQCTTLVIWLSARLHAATLSLAHWSYCSLALSNQYIIYKKGFRMVQYGGLIKVILCSLIKHYTCNSFALRLGNIFQTILSILFFQDSGDFYLVKLVPKADLFQSVCPPDLLVKLMYFVNHICWKQYSRLIPWIEWVEGYSYHNMQIIWPYCSSLRLLDS